MHTARTTMIASQSCYILAISVCFSDCAPVYVNTQGLHIKLIQLLIQETVLNLQHSTVIAPMKFNLTPHSDPFVKGHKPCIAVIWCRPLFRAFCNTEHPKTHPAVFSFFLDCHVLVFLWLFMCLNLKYIEIERTLPVWYSLNCFPVPYIFTTSYKYLKWSQWCLLWVIIHSVFCVGMIAKLIIQKIGKSRQTLWPAGPQRTLFQLLEKPEH